MRLASMLSQPEAGADRAAGSPSSRIAAAVVLDGAEYAIDLGVACPELPRGMCRFLAAGDRALEATRLAIERAQAGDHAEALVPVDQVRWLPVVPKPQKLLAIGLNYAAHAEETGRQPPEFPTVFNKQVSCLNAHNGDIVMPRESNALDYEGELAFVIGTRCRRVPKERAAEVIAGFTVCNDVSVRDWQRRSPTMIMGKGWDTHGPLGPWLVTRDEVGDAHDLRLRTTVDGEVRQEGHTADLVFDCYTLVEILSTAFTLEPGDVVATGTPSGVGVAFDPPRFLEVGSTVRIEIERVGVLENQVVADVG